MFSFRKSLTAGTLRGGVVLLFSKNLHVHGVCSVFVQNAQEGVERARREHYAFILDSPIAEYMSGREPCDLYVTEPFLDERSYALGVQKGNMKLLEPLNDAIVCLRTSGELDLLYKKWFIPECGLHSQKSQNQKRNKNSSPDATPKPVTESQVYSTANKNFTDMVFILTVSLILNHLTKT